MSTGANTATVRSVGSAMPHSGITSGVKLVSQSDGSEKKGTAARAGVVNKVGSNVGSYVVARVERRNVAEMSREVTQNGMATPGTEQRVVVRWGQSFECSQRITAVTGNVSERQTCWPA